MVLAKALTAVLRCFHGLGHAASNRTKQNEQEDPMPETTIRRQGSPFGSACCPTHRMCGMRGAQQWRLPRS